jgi:hypothetical protein
MTSLRERLPAGSARDVAYAEHSAKFRTPLQHSLHPMDSLMSATFPTYPLCLANSTATHDKMGIQELPQELWDRIVLATEESDWMQLQLVCKRFEHTATACLFSNLSVCLQTKSLRRSVIIFCCSCTSDIGVRVGITQRTLYNDGLKPS